MREEIYRLEHKNVSIYDKVYKAFDALYPKLKENWNEILALDISASTTKED